MILSFLGMRNIKRILVRSTNWIGDSIMSLPAIEQLRESFPEAHISVLLRPWVKPIFEAHPAVNEIILYDKRGIGGILRVVKEIRNRNFQMAILFQNAFEAAFISFLAGIKIRVGINKDLRGFLLTHPVRRNKNQHHTRNYLDIISAIGIKAEERDPVLYLKQEYLFKAEKVITEYGVKGDFLVGFSPGAMYGSAKRWPKEYFAEIADRCIEEWNAKVILFGSRKESDICKQISRAVKNNIIDLSGKTDLGTSMGIIKRCNLFLSNDSGLMHVASSLSVPTIGIFGSTDPNLTGPKGPFTKVIWSRIPCSPCFKRECPYSLKCLYSITPDQVWEKMEEIRNETGNLYR